jgi:hypothetical protein
MRCCYVGFGALLLACASSVVPSPGATTPAPASARERAAVGAAIEAITRALPDTAPACFDRPTAPSHFVPDSIFFRERSPTRRFLPHEACPPTYHTMAGPLRDPEGRPITRPTGYIAPHWFRVYHPWFEGETEGGLRIVRTQSTSTYYYGCQLRTELTDRRRWAATCRLVDRMVN